MVASGKLAATLPVFSFKKMLEAIKNKSYEGKVAGNIPVLKYESVLQNKKKKPGLGPLHTEFDDKGFAPMADVQISHASIQTIDLPPLH